MGFICIKCHKVTSGYSFRDHSVKSEKVFGVCRICYMDYKNKCIVRRRKK